LVTTAPVSLNFLEEEVDQQHTRTSFLELIGILEEDNFTLTRLLLVFFSYEIYDDLYGWDDWDWDYNNDYYYNQFPMIHDFDDIAWAASNYSDELWVLFGYNNMCYDCSWMHWDIYHYYYNTNPNHYLRLYVINYNNSWSSAPFGFTWDQPFLAIYDGDVLIEIVYNPGDILDTMYNLSQGTYLPPGA
ncbi:MAG: hypothetical protein ACNA7U_02825, partial [Candidatus Izemoplasmataceae bacterium]